MLELEKLSIFLGEHVVTLLSKSTKIINTCKNKFRHFTSTDVYKTDIFITLNDGYGIPFKNYTVEVTEDTNKIAFKRADYLIEVNPEYTHAIIQFNDHLALKHALMNLYSAFIVHKRWGLLIHSSCAIDNEKAHVFAGHSGAGKSTAAKLSQPRKLLSDEATILKISPEKITVFNSPFRSELESNGNERFKSLESIQILHQALINKRVKLKKREALLQLTDKVFYWAYSPNETLKILNLLKELVNNVPVYELHFRKDNTFWELISC